MNVMYKWKYVFLFPFQSFIIFSCFIAVARTYNTMLNESHDNEFTAVFPFLGPAFSGPQEGLHQGPGAAPAQECLSCVLCAQPLLGGL